MSFHLVTLNIKESNAPEETSAFKEELLGGYASAPVIFGLQELDVNAPRSRRLNVPEIIANGDDYRFTASVEYDAKSGTERWTDQDQKPALYGIGLIAANATILSSHSIPLGPDEDRFWQACQKGGQNHEIEPRKALLCEIQLAKGTVWVATTHLAYHPNRTKPNRIRQKQIQALLKAVGTIVPSQAPLVLCGDFNATPENPDLEPLRQHFTQAQFNEPTKITKTGTREQIDHIFYRNLKESKKACVIETTFSDHSAVLAHFR
ncbi:MAG: endonuclease/exonuclease/phosphatase family protein [Bdellovibrionales bacterium]